METIWAIAAMLIGIGIGLGSGFILRATVMFWDGTSKALKTFHAILLLILGGSAIGATALFQNVLTNGAAFYVGGLGLGLIVGVTGFFFPVRRIQLKEVELIVKMSDGLRKDMPDARKRTILIFAALQPQGKEMGSELGKAADEVAGTTNNPQA